MVRLIIILLFIPFVVKSQVRPHNFDGAVNADSIGIKGPNGSVTYYDSTSFVSFGSGGNSDSATYADTAGYALNVVSSDSSVYSDTSGYALNTAKVDSASYSDTAGVALLSIATDTSTVDQVLRDYVFGDNNTTAGTNSFIAGGKDNSMATQANYSFLTGENNLLIYDSDRDITPLNGFMGGRRNTGIGWYSFASGTGNYVDGKISGAIGNNNIASGNDGLAAGNQSIIGRLGFPVKGEGIADAGSGLGNRYWTSVDSEWGFIAHMFPNKLNPTDSLEAWYGVGAQADDSGNVYANNFTIPTDLQWAAHTYGILKNNSESGDTLCKIVKVTYSNDSTTIYWATDYKPMDDASGMLYAYSSTSPVVDFRHYNAASNGMISLGKLSQSWGTGTTALGYDTKAWNIGAFASGFNTKALAPYSTAMGLNSRTTVGATNAFAIGDSAIASGISSAAFNSKTVASGTNSFAINKGIASGISSFGSGTSTASGDFSFAGGSTSTAIGASSFAFGNNNTATATGAFAVGSSTEASAQGSHAEGQGTTASGIYSHAEGQSSTAQGESSHAEGFNTLASGITSHAEGFESQATANYTHAEGYQTDATTLYAHSEGYQTLASGTASHSEGDNTIASGNYSHAGGQQSDATAPHTFSHGYYALASGDQSFSANERTTASGNESAAFGYYSEASGNRSFASGERTEAKGTQSGAYNYYTDADGAYSNAFNFTTNALGSYSNAFGRESKAILESEIALANDNYDSLGDVQHRMYIKKAEYSNAGYHPFDFITQLSPRKTYYGKTKIVGRQSSESPGKIGESAVYEFDWVIDARGYWDCNGDSVNTSADRISIGDSLPADTRIIIKNTGSIPGGLSINSYYYVINPDATSFQLSLSSGGSARNLTSTGTSFQPIEMNVVYDDIQLIARNFENDGDDVGNGTSTGIYVTFGSTQFPNFSLVLRVYQLVNRTIRWTAFSEITEIGTMNSQ